MTFTDFITDVSIASVMIVLCQILRAKVKWIQKLMLPAPLLAGLFGLLLGPQFLNILHLTDNMSSYVSNLLYLIFAGLFLGKKQKINARKIFDEAGDSFFINLAAEIGQFGVMILSMAVVLSLFFPSVPGTFGILNPAGFVGGHGYAGAIGSTVENMTGWTEAVELGQAFATFGLLSAIFFGVPLINIAVRRGWTNFVSDVKHMDAALLTGFVDDETDTAGRNTTSNNSIASFAWHFALLMIALGMTYGINNLYSRLNTSVSLPLVCIAMFCGMIVTALSKLLKVDHYIDSKVISGMSSGFTDYLVFFGVASIRISVVIKYAAPMLISILLVWVYNLLFLFFVSRKLFVNNWFERGIFIFGYSNGVVATGMTLLRIVDPEFKSNALQDYGLAYTIISFIEIALVSIAPVMVAYGYQYQTGIVLIALTAALVFCAVLFKKKHATGEVGT